MIKKIVFALLASIISAILTRREYEKKIQRITDANDVASGIRFIRTHSEGYIEGYQRAKLDNTLNLDRFPLIPKD